MTVMPMSYERVVITGLGVLCPVGQDMDSTWQALIHGQSGIDYITLFDAGDFVTRFAGEVKGFHPTDHIIRRQAHPTDTGAICWLRRRPVSA